MKRKNSMKNTTKSMLINKRTVIKLNSNLQHTSMSAPAQSHTNLQVKTIYAEFTS